MPVWLNSIFIDYADTGFAKWRCESKRSRLALDPLQLQHTNKSVRTVHQKTTTTFKPKKARDLVPFFQLCPLCFLQGSALSRFAVQPHNIH